MPYKKVSFNLEDKNPEEQFDIEKSNQLDDTIEPSHQKTNDNKNLYFNCRCILRYIRYICPYIIKRGC